MELRNHGNPVRFPLIFFNFIERFSPGAAAGWLPSVPAAFVVAGFCYNLQDPMP